MLSIPPPEQGDCTTAPQRLLLRESFFAARLSWEAIRLELVVYNIHFGSVFGLNAFQLLEYIIYKYKKYRII